MIDEKVLIQQAQSGDRQAVAQLYNAHYAPVFRFIAYRINDPTLAEDLTAEVFIQMVKKIDTFQDRGRPFLAWLYVIASNIVKMYFRKQRKTEFEPLPVDMIDQTASPDNITQMKLSQARLMKALPRLTEIQRQVILLKFIEGFSNGEIAKLLNRNEGSIKSLQHRALNALRRILSEEVTHEPI